MSTYYRWRKEYGGQRVDQAERFKEMEKENARLKKLLTWAEAWRWSSLWLRRNSSPLLRG